jgi:RNA recognition motif-containing protein
MSKKTKETIKPIYIQNLNFKTTEETIKEKFSEYGEIEKIEMGAGKAKIYYFKEESREYALSLRTFSLDDRIIKIRGEIEKSNEIMVINVPFEASEYEVRELFEKYGTIESLELDGKRYYIKYQNINDAEKAFEMDKQMLMDRELQIEYKRSTEAWKKIGEESNSVFIAGLSTLTTKEGLMNSFSECGKVLNLSLTFFEDTGRPKFAFIDFEDVESAKRAVEYNGTMFDGKRIKIEFAKGSQKKNTKNEDFKKYEKEEKPKKYEEEDEKPKNEKIKFDYTKKSNIKNNEEEEKEIEKPKNEKIKFDYTKKSNTKKNEEVEKEKEIEKPKNEKIKFENTKKKEKDSSSEDSESKEDSSSDESEPEKKKKKKSEKSEKSEMSKKELRKKKREEKKISKEQVKLEKKQVKKEKKEKKREKKEKKAEKKEKENKEKKEKRKMNLKIFDENPFEPIVNKKRKLETSDNDFSKKQKLDNPFESNEFDAISEFENSIKKDKTFRGRGRGRGGKR